MKQTILIPFLLLLSNILFSQTNILDEYPATQYFYEKGELNFIKDLQDAANENGVKPCKDEKENYTPKFIVFPDRTSKFVKDSDSVTIQKNKCAYDFSRNVFKYLTGWNPVIMNGAAYPALVSYDVNPAELFKYKINADLQPEFKSAEYRGGPTAFFIGAQKLIGPIFNDSFSTLVDQSVTLRFKISKYGVIEDVDIPHSMPFRLKDEILEAVRGLQKWKPATKNGVPVSQYINVTLRFRD